MIKLYYLDTHMTEFDAVVESCTKENGRFKILLDRTAFFPEEGGQGADAGTLAGQPVLDVQIENGSVFHYLDLALQPGCTVRGCVDFSQRFDYMQQHSGEHIISGLVHAAYGYDNVGFHLGKKEMTFDFNGSLTFEELREIEADANRIVWQDLPVNILYPSDEERNAMDYRSKLALTEDVRIVEIPGVDLCACCAPHVDRTGQIGLIKITGVQSHRGGVRVTALCGDRALQEFSMHQDSVISISNQLSARQEAVSEAVFRLKEENLRMKERVNSLQAKLLSLSVRLLPPPEEQNSAVLFTGELDNIAVRYTVNDLCSRYPGYCILFSGDDEKGYRYIIGSASEDCREPAAFLKEQFQAKGGGSARMVQGSIKAPAEEIRRSLEGYLTV